jgi:hypothetical protein
MIDKLYEILEQYESIRLAIRTEDDNNKIAALKWAIYTLENQVIDLSSYGF